jgi:hypothetical protein
MATWCTKAKDPVDSLSDWPSRRLLGECPEGTLYLAEAAGKFYLLVDNSAFFDLLDTEDRLEMGAPFQVREFGSEVERRYFLKLRRWA